MVVEMGVVTEVLKGIVTETLVVVMDVDERHSSLVRTVGMRNSGEQW